MYVRQGAVHRRRPTNKYTYEDRKTDGDRYARSNHWCLCLSADRQHARFRTLSSSGRSLSHRQRVPRPRLSSAAVLAAAHWLCLSPARERHLRREGGSQRGERRHPRTLRHAHTVTFKRSGNTHHICTLQCTHQHIRGRTFRISAICALRSNTSLSVLPCSSCGPPQPMTTNTHVHTSMRAHTHTHTHKHTHKHVSVVMALVSILCS